MKRTVSSPCSISVIPLSPGYIIPSALSRFLSHCPTCFEPGQVARELIKAIVEKEKVESYQTALSCIAFSLFLQSLYSFGFIQNHVQCDVVGCSMC